MSKALEKMELLCITAGSVKWYGCSRENSMKVPQKLENNYDMIQYNDSTSAYRSKELKVGTSCIFVHPCS